MRKIALIAFAALPLFAGFFPSTVETSVSKVDKNAITLSSSFPVNGMSGIVIHDYGNKSEAITSRLVQSSTGAVTLLHNDIIHHDKLPTVNTAVKTGDRVIGGYLYHNVLVLAPDAATYAKITSAHNKKWVHPDLFALFLSKIGDGTPSKKNLATFAKEYQVGLIYIVRHNSAVLLDPISGHIVGEKKMTNLPAEGKFPFYMRFEEIQRGWFGGDDKGNYYKTMESL